MAVKKKAAVRKKKKAAVVRTLQLPLDVAVTLSRAAQLAELPQEVVVLSIIAVAIARAERMGMKK